MRRLFLYILITLNTKYITLNTKYRLNTNNLSFENMG